MKLVIRHGYILGQHLGYLLSLIYKKFLNNILATPINE